MAQAILEGVKVISALTADQTNTSAAIDSQRITQIFVVCTVTGATAPVGVLNVYGACMGVNSSSSAYALLSSAQVKGTSAVNANATFCLTVPECPFNSFKVEYTRTSGSGGTMDIWVSGKSTGG
jgi:hypothetical protein